MADTKLTGLPAAAAVGATDLLYGSQSAASVKITAAQLKTFAATAPGGSPTYVQVNTASAFAGYADFTYTLATKTVAMDNITLAAAGFNGSGTPALVFTGTAGNIYVSAPGPSFAELYIQVPTGGGSLILGDSTNSQFQFAPNAANPRLSLQGHGGIYYIDANTWSTGTANGTGLMDIQLRLLQPKVFTVLTLPSAASLPEGTRSHVSDALAPAFGVAVASGGAVSVPVFVNGASTWIVG